MERRITDARSRRCRWHNGSGLEWPADGDIAVLPPTSMDVDLEGIPKDRCREIIQDFYPPMPRGAPGP
jgi:hypothetical protein